MGRHCKEGSKVTAQEFLRRYNNPHRRPQMPDQTSTKTKAPRSAPPIEAVTLIRELIVEQIGRGVVSPKEIYRRVTDEYGSLNIRRFWRVMRYLVDEGIIERLPEGYQNMRVGRRA